MFSSLILPARADCLGFHERILRSLEDDDRLSSTDRRILRDSPINTGVETLGLREDPLYVVPEATSRSLPSFLSEVSIPISEAHGRVIVDLVVLVRALVDRQHGEQEIGYPVPVRSTGGAGVRAQGREQSRFRCTS